MSSDDSSVPPPGRQSSGGDSVPPPGSVPPPVILPFYGTIPLRDDLMSGLVGLTAAESAPAEAHTPAETVASRARPNNEDPSSVTRLDAWPNTTRPLPWLVAAFAVMVYLIPFDSIFLPIHLPVDSALDRFVLVAMFLVWVGCCFGGRARPRFKHAPVNVAIYAFAALCSLSLLLNTGQLSWDGDLPLSIKQISLIASYITLFFIVSTGVEREDAIPLLKLAVVLATLTAIGTVYQYRSGVNLFFNLAGDIFKGATVSPAPVAEGGGRAAITGPTTTGLADVSILASAVPFAIVFATRAHRRRDVLFWCACGLALLVGCISTQRKTGLILPVAAIVVLILYDPRRYIRYWPFLIPGLGIIELAAPHAISGLYYQLTTASTSTSTTTRTSDYSAVWPYIATHLLFGRGYGSFNPQKYRILDDQILGSLIEIGVFGTLAYVSMAFATIVTVHSTARRDSGIRGAAASAVAAMSLAFFVSNFLYDAFGFRQGVYAFFLYAGLGVALIERRRDPLATAEQSSRPVFGPENDSSDQVEGVLKSM